jgi:hypothetical protein
LSECRYNAPVAQEDERARLEREIAELSRRVDGANGELARLRDGGPEPRGLAPGLAVGMAIVIGGFLLLWMLVRTIVDSTN